MKENNLIVSICCNTYNHEKYIEKAIDGFLNQNTEFKFEILIYDDASTDNTAQKIKEYQKKYPDIIKPIYQTINQYSKNISTFQENANRAQGKYIAICEGDDYWIDCKKLKKQVDYMENHPECTFCFTNAFVSENNELTKKVIPWTKESALKDSEDRFYDVGEIEMLGYIPTASFLFPNYVYKNRPVISKEAFQGDGYIKLFATAAGYAYYFPEETCIYCVGVENSETTIWKKNRSKALEASQKFALMYKELSEILDKKYFNILIFRQYSSEINAIFLSKEYKKLKNKKYDTYIKKSKNKLKVKLVLCRKIPFVYEAVHRIINWKKK